MADAGVTAQDWVWGVTFSVLASVIGGASKLAIRKSWIIYGRLNSGSTADALPATTSQDIDITKSDSTGSGLSTMEILETAFSSEPDGSPLVCKRISKAKAVSWFLYLFGLVGMSFLNPLCSVLAMQYANPSILAPFSGLSLVLVIMFSGVITGENPLPTQKLACALIVAGEIIVALFGDHSNASNMDVDEVVASYHDPAFIVYMILMFTFIALLLLIIRNYPTTSLLTKMAWGSLGGAIVGFQNFLKDAMTIFTVATSEGDRLPAIFYLLFILAVATAITALMCISASMKRYDATYASAMFVASVVISTSLMSAVHYHTFEEIEGAGDIIMYLLGLAVLIYGATILVRPTTASCIPDKYDEPDETDYLEAGSAGVGVYGSNQAL